MAKYASIFNAENPEDPEILVHGYGRMRHSQLKKQAEFKVNAFLNLVKKENYQMAAWLTYEEHDVMIVYLRALKDVEDEIERLGKLSNKK